MARRNLVKILAAFALAYVLFCITVYVKPQWFFYHPTNEAPDIEKARAEGYPAERVEYRAEDGKELYAWFTPPGKSRRIIVFMHGNSYNIEKFYHKLIPLARAGYGTMIPEYRGFGDIDGTITEKTVGQDAVAAVKWLYSQGYRNKDIIVYGMSLGSYAATNAVYVLGQKNPFAALILEVPFDSLLNVVRSVVPVPLPFAMIIKDKYDNLSKIAYIGTPLLVMGGSEDPTVPVKLAKNLFAHAVEPKKMIVYEGGAHNDLYNFQNYRDIIKWLQANEKAR